MELRLCEIRKVPCTADIRLGVATPEVRWAPLKNNAIAENRLPEDVVGSAIFLASDLAAYVTGTIIMADGGYRTV